jgi:hypothetical protein
MNSLVTVNQINQYKYDASVTGNYLAFDKPKKRWIALRKTQNMCKSKATKDLIKATKFLRGDIS